MNLSLQQINNLITGTGLAAEIPASTVELRRYVVIRGYELNEWGHPRRLSKTIAKDKLYTALFEIRDYEISVSYIENGWDITEDCCMNYNITSDILGIAKAEEELSKYLSDFSLLIPEWKCSNPL